jgi:hypothetical protein
VLTRENRTDDRQLHDRLRRATCEDVPGHPLARAARTARKPLFIGAPDEGNPEKGRGF